MTEEIFKKEFYSKIQAKYQAALFLVVTRSKNCLSLMESNGKEIPADVVFRMKEHKSLWNKIIKKFQEKDAKIEDATMEEALECVNDIAGQRIIVLFRKQIKDVENAIRHFPGMSVVKTKDYVSNPKPNGYRSLHLIVNVEIYTEEGTELIPVEIQIRSCAMDLWAKLEHYLYKNKGNFPEEFRGIFKQTAKALEKIDGFGDQIYESINKKTSPEAMN